MALKDLFIKQQFDWIVSTVVFNFRRVTGVMQASHVALAVKNPSANAGDTGDSGLIPGLAKSVGGGNSNPLQYSCLGNPWTEEPGGLQSMGSLRVGHD